MIAESSPAVTGVDRGPHCRQADKSAVAGTPTKAIGMGAGRNHLLKLLFVAAIFGAATLRILDSITQVRSRGHAQREAITHDPPAPIGWQNRLMFKLVPHAEIHGLAKT